MLSFFKKKDSPMWLFVGLGNPGDKYQYNRHNIGFMVMDELAEGDYRAKFQGAYQEQRLDNQKIGILKPATYMNESGRSVSAAAKFYKIPSERIIIFHDELDLKSGEVRVKQGGGNAGHNGLKSIQAHLGTPDFWRVRIGIGHPGDKNQVSNYVLSDFSKTETPVFEDIVYKSAKHADLLIQGDDKTYYDAVNQR
jgi:PTH1 family peptidyl-tRNA hydrolase